MSRPELTLRTKLEIARNNYQVFGLWQTTKDVLVYLLGARVDDFDRKYGVATGGVVEARDAEIQDGRLRASAVRYVPTREPVIRHLLARVLRGLDPSTFSFVDLGCGRGRTLLVAAQFSFARVLGVELSPLHCRQARENVARFLARARPGPACTRLDVVCANAAECELPDSDLLVYMYRPFTGAVFEAVLEHLARFRRQSGRRVLLALTCPAEEYLIAARSDYVKLGEHNVISPEYSWCLWECGPT